MQGVELSNRFAMVPFGPPSLSYSPSAKALVSFNAEANEVQLVADRTYEKGEAVFAWCGPQPNSRLLINYGIVDEENPFDKVPITAVLTNTDPLFRAKRTLLDAASAHSRASLTPPESSTRMIFVCYLQHADRSAQDADRCAEIITLSVLHY